MEEQVVINKTYRANSYEFGKAGNRFKLYFEDAADLKTQIDNLIQQGLYSEEVIKFNKGGNQNG
jgi:hypothetical protein